MSFHTLDAPSTVRLKRLVGARSDQIVLDVDAVYIVGPNETITVKARCVTADSPEPNRYDEVFPISVTVLKEDYTFERQGEAGKIYRVVAEDQVITQIDVVRVGIRFPDEVAVPPSTVDGLQPGINIVDCGVFIHTSQGILVALQRHPGFGFHWGSHRPDALYDQPSSLALLPPCYELATVA